MVFYNATLVFIRISLFLQYWRLIREITQYRTFFLSFSTVVMMWSLGILLTLVFICVPVEGYWNKTIPAKCLGDKEVQITNSIGNIITDLSLLALPIPIIWKLNLSKERKIALTGIFGLGLFGCLVSMLRAYFVFRIGDGSDLPLDAVTTSCWTLAEITAGTVCSCLITLQPLLKQWKPTWTSQKRYAGQPTNRPSGKSSSHWQSVQASQGDRNGDRSGLTASGEQGPNESAFELCASNNMELSSISLDRPDAHRSHPSVSTMTDIPLEQFDTITATSQRNTMWPVYQRELP